MVHTEKKIKRAFVLGAGFSKSFCQKMPTIPDLTSGLFERREELRQQYPELVDYVFRYDEKSSHAPEIRNIENIATAILSKRVFQNDLERNSYDILRYQILKFIYSEIDEYSVDSDEGLRLLGEFADVCDESTENRLITFNYDLFLESTGAWIHYGVTNSYPVTGYQNTARRPTEYIKLHGSFNWYRAKGTNTQDMHYTYRVDRDDPEYRIHKEDIPVFIPMAHAKDSFLNGSLFNTLWAMASQVLSSSDEIYFLGYGFPPTDIGNLFFFLNYKEKIKRIVVYNEESSPEFRRLRDIFGDAILLKQDAKDYLTENLEKWR